MQPSRLIKVLVLERDAESARAVATLALEAIPQDVETIVGKATSIDGAKRIIDRLASEQAAPLIVICAADLDEEGKALEILDIARQQHPLTRAVVLTDGESRQFRRALEAGVDGLHDREAGLEGLRRILAYLGSARHEPVALDADSGRADALHAAKGALASALDRLEDAHHHLSSTADAAWEEARRKVRQAQHHAVLAHRSALEAERLLHEHRTRDADRDVRNS